MFREIILYILHPVFREQDQPDSLRTRLRFVWNGWLVCMCTFIASVSILMTVEYFVVHVLHQPPVIETLNRKSRTFDKRLGRWAFPVIVLIGPFFEECIFRLPLRLKKKHVALFTFVLFYFISNRYLQKPDVYDFTMYLAPGAGTIAALLVLYRMPQRRLDMLRGKYFIYLFYGSAIGFGLIHINNFYDPAFPAPYFYPLYTLPQLCMGLVIGTVRMRYGFWYGLLLHAMINVPPAVTALF